MAHLQNPFNLHPTDARSYYHLKIKPTLLGLPGIRHARDFIDAPPRAGWRTWLVVFFVGAVCMLFAYWHGQRTMSAGFDARAALAKTAAIAKAQAQLADDRAELDSLRAQFAVERREHQVADDRAAANAGQLVGTCLTAADVARIKR